MSRGTHPGMTSITAQIHLKLNQSKSDDTTKHTLLYNVVDSLLCFYFERQKVTHSFTLWLHHVADLITINLLFTFFSIPVCAWCTMWPLVVLFTLQIGIIWENSIEMLIKITLTIIYSQFSLSPKLFSSLLDDHEDKQDATHTHVVHLLLMLLFGSCISMLRVHVYMDTQYLFKLFNLILMVGCDRRKQEPRNPSMEVVITS